jgi:hypothetical protein
MARKAKIRFSNQSHWDELSINMDDFLSSREFEDEVFGWYKGMYVSILKKSLEENDGE